MKENEVFGFSDQGVHYLPNGADERFEAVQKETGAFLNIAPHLLFTTVKTGINLLKMPISTQFYNLKFMRFLSERLGGFRASAKL